MKTWITSDTHFGHTNSILYCGRPYLNKTQMDEALVANWNSIVAPEDTVYHLGDVAMKMNAVKAIIPRLNGKKILIVGNHDLMYPYFTKSRGAKFTKNAEAQYLEAGFAEVHPGSFILTRTGNTNIRLCHFPTKSAYDPYHNDKHDSMRPADDGSLNICGHVHDSWLKRGNNINAGVDVWNMRPVLLKDLLMLEAKGDLDAPKRIRRYCFKLLHKVLRLFREDRPPQSQQRGKRVHKS